MSADVRPSSQWTEAAGSGAAVLIRRAHMVATGVTDQFAFVATGTGNLAAAFVLTNGNYVFTRNPPADAVTATIVQQGGDFIVYS